MTEINEELKVDVGSSVENTADNAPFHYNDPVVMQAAAIAYARADFACVATYPIVKGPGGDPECGCMSEERKRGNLAPLPCTQPGKHPRMRWKFDKDGNPAKDLDEGQVRRLWEPQHGKHRGANIGIKTGSKQKLFVVDYDGETGQQSWGAYKAANGITHIETPEDVSGSGKGGHVYFFYDGPEIPNSASLLASHVDTRGTDGLIYVAPSNHKSGGQYRWVKGRALGEIDLAPLPQCIIDDLAKARPAGSAKGLNKNAGKCPRRDSDFCDSDPYEEAGDALRFRAAGLKEHLALIGDGEDQAGFDGPVYSSACCFFATEGDDVPAETIKEILHNAILAAECRDGRAEGRYSTDRYLDTRIEQARDFIKGANEAKHQRVLGEVERIALLVDGFTKATDEKTIRKAYQALAAIVDEAPPGLVSDIVVKLGKVSGRTTDKSKKYLDAIVKGIRDDVTDKQAEEKRLADNEASGLDLVKKPTLALDVDNFPYMVDVAWRRLEAVNKVQHIYFEIGGVKVRLDAPDSEGRLTPTRLGVEGILAELNQHVLWKDGDRYGSADKDVAAQLFRQSDLHFSTITGFVSAPFFGPDGTLIDSRGYHADAKLFYQPPPGFLLPPVPKHLTSKDVKEALALILDNVFVDFPFSDGADDKHHGRASRAHAMAMLLGLFMRPMIPGDLPIFFVQKPQAGTGASLLIKSAMHIPLGRTVEARTQPEGDKSEMRKVLTSFLMEGEPVLFFDNINEHVHGAALANFATCGTWKDRLLGGNRNFSGAVTCTTILAGNNVAMSSEIARRCAPILLDTRESPTDRAGFTHDLEPWVKAHRGELVAACLTLIRYWIDQGKPHWKGKPLASFEGWSRVMGGLLECIGVEGFLENRHIATEAASGDDEVWGELCAMLFDRYSDQMFRISDDLVGVLAENFPELIKGVELPAQRVSFGKRLAHQRRVHKAPDGRLFRLSGSGRGTGNRQSWRVELIGANDYSRHANDMMGTLTLDDLDEGAFADETLQLKPLAQWCDPRVEYRKNLKPDTSKVFTMPFGKKDKPPLD